MRHKSESDMLLDIASYARRGPGRRDHLSSAEIELIARTVRRTPEVMVKVLSRGGRDLGALRRHLAYLNRGGELEIETDDGQRLSGKGIEKQLLQDWDLDIEQHRSRAELEPRANRSPPKLVHKVLFSMPAGTPSEKVLAAVKNFAREEFALKHRYAMALHTDEPHPHVHMVVKAMSEQGERLNIRKATLREWRREFARHLRGQGVAANATDRVIRGETKPRKLDGVHRAMLRGESTHMRNRTQALAVELLKGDLKAEKEKAQLLDTRRVVQHGWQAVSHLLAGSGKRDLANLVKQFVEQMPPPCTENEWLVAQLRDRLRHERVQQPHVVR